MKKTKQTIELISAVVVNGLIVYMAISKDYDLSQLRARVDGLRKRWARRFRRANEPAWKHELREYAVEDGWIDIPTNG